METYRKDKALNIMSRLFYCDITDRLPCFLSLKFEKYRKISNIRYKAHQISKLKLFSPRLAVVCAQSIEAMC